MNEIERSIIKTYRKDIWKKFIDSINKYNLVNESDKIAVCISGGKDSLLLSLLLKELKLHGQVNFDLEYIMVNPGYNIEYINWIKELTSSFDINLKVYDTDIFNVVDNVNHKNNCYICAKMRRGYLYDCAKKLGCNKIALGHHLDDVIETTFLNMFYNGNYETMRPILNSDNYEGMSLIRPMYLIKEDSIIKWINYNNIEIKNYICGFNKDKSKRIYLKSFINQLRKDNKFFDSNMINALENVNLDNINGYIKDKIKYKNY